MGQGTYEQAEYEGVSTLHWAKRQLKGVMDEGDPRYKSELLRMGLIFLDATEMEMVEWRIRHIHLLGSSYQLNGSRNCFISEHMPKSYSWLV